MELRQLQYFIAVVEEANFTRAAERVLISQSGVSAQIRALERELGAELLDRSGRQVTLTAAGEAALPHARAAVAAAGAAQLAVDEVRGLVRGRLTVGMVTGCTIHPLFDALADFRRAHPGVSLTLAEDTSDRLVAGVKDGSIDLALAGIAAEPPADLESHVIVDERLVALVPLTHPLAACATVTLLVLVGFPLICMPGGTGIRTAFDRSCAAANVSAPVPLEASASSAIADLALRGLGVGIVSESLAAGYDDRLKTLAIEDADTAALLALVWRHAPSPAAEKLIEHCRRAFGQGASTGPLTGMPTRP